jgi:hypothetical protein
VVGCIGKKVGSVQRKMPGARKQSIANRMAIQPVIVHHKEAATCGRDIGWIFSCSQVALAINLDSRIMQ